VSYFVALLIFWAVRLARQNLAEISVPRRGHPRPSWTVAASFCRGSQAGKVVLKTQTLLLVMIGSLAGLVSAARGFGSDVKLAWDPNPEPDVAGYKVYVRTLGASYGSGTDVGNATTFAVQNLGVGIYFFAITAYNTSGRESNRGSEIPAILGPDST